MTEDRSLQAYARWAGALYIISMAVYIAQDSILAGFVVRGDFAATALNVRQGEGLYRLGLALRVLGGLALVGLGWTFYGLLKAAAPTTALVALVLRGVQAALDVLGAVGLYAGLRNYLDAGDATAGRELTRGLIAQAGGDAFQIQFVYLGFVSVLVFWVLLRSRLVPPWLSGFGLAACAALMVQAFVHLMAPEFVRGLGLGMLEYIPMFLAEIGTGLWLVVRGADTRRLRGG